MKIGNHRLDISSRDKIFFPDRDLTKGDLVDYYETMAEVMIPHMEHYGVNMHRFPDGVGGKDFYHKDTPDYFPDWIERIEFPRREKGGSFRAPVVDSKAALVYLADQAVIAHHLYLARADDLEKPDKMVYDLDPPEDTEDFAATRRAALELEEVMEELDMTPFVQTTGSKGFHIVVPLDRSAGFDEIRQFARDVALLLVRRKPDAYTLEQRKDKRGGRIFLDYLRNAYGATSIAPYSARGRPGATVATPLDWGEVEDGAHPRDWDITNIPGRLAQKDDPWKGLHRHAVRAMSRRGRLDELLDAEDRAQEEG
ncbi:ATP-dependent DNA ligase [Marinicauda algicola]|uniref:ATP-dependent DNA ligase n=1 Tax=Marinicauda algicola TaxID=2029849 RepID=A0A4S2GWY3_9PROT|nr:non-homologous end-joining DNA ligase [Marinicauda algicola]TGY87566.1 ATP-dependent DNA ligase [Marinicauda algicola]